MKGLPKRILPFLLIAVLFLSLAFYPKKTGAVDPQRVVEIWNVDTFEGGKGSRTAFLGQIARKLEGDGRYFYVLSYTAEGARKAFSDGNCPDMISFGLGLPEVGALALPLSRDFYGARPDGRTLAVPWCMGKYYLFCLEDDFGKEGAYAISRGGANLPEVAAALAGIRGEVLDASEAYVRFLNGEFRYLLGTQRDVKRFESRGTVFFSKKLSLYNDLYQCLAILKNDRREDCDAFLDVMLSGETRSRLADIGMLPPDPSERYTVSLFASNDALAALRKNAAEGGEINFLEKYLKSR